MPKRFTATEIWEEDWFIEMPKDYKLFWFYVKDICDHAGVFKVNTSIFNKLNDAKVDASTALELFNKGKKRLRSINGSLWLLEDFFIFQYGQHFNENNRVHKSIKEVYKKVGVKLGSIRGLIEDTEGVKDKDKDKDKE